MGNRVFKKVMTGLILGAALSSAQAIPLLSGFGGPEGYGALTQSPNDDGSSNALTLPFAINFFNAGTPYTRFFVNNNGNITFNSQLGSFTPRPFPIANQPTIAPYWGDVDTSRQPGGGAVYAAATPDNNNLVVTWHNVGYFSSHNNLLNDFQLVLTKRTDTGVGNFDIQFRYNQLQWTTGDASGGSSGFGGTPAQAGYNGGDGVHFFVLPGSRTNDVLDLANTSNVSNATPGLWTMAIRGGATSAGQSVGSPLLPSIVNPDGSYQFDFGIVLGQRIFIDPVVAVGYEYRVQSGPNILTALFPSVAGDVDGYFVYSLLGSLLGTVNPGDVFNFEAGGVDGFRLEGIDVGAGLDPANTQAFSTGLTFVSAGQVSMTQTPLTFNTGNSVPEPSTVMLMFLALVGLGLMQSKRQH